MSCCFAAMALIRGNSYTAVSVSLFFCVCVVAYLTLYMYLFTCLVESVSVLQGEEFTPESFHSRIECENPNNDLSRFRGYM